MVCDEYRPCANFEMQAEFLHKTRMEKRFLEVMERFNPKPMVRKELHALHFYH